MKAMQVVTPKELLEMKDVDCKIESNKQVIVKVESSGVCHSDIHVWQGGYEGKKGEVMKVEERGVKFPLTLGHEIAGVVEKIGDSVNSVGLGDRVLVYPWIGDGSCDACKGGDEHVCDNPKSLGIYQNGGYAERILVPDEKYLVKIGNLDSDKVCSLSCSGLTAYTAVKKANPKTSQYLVIIGAGGLGLMAIQIAKAIGNPSLIVVDIDDDRLKRAHELGADFTVNSKTSDVVKTVKEKTKDRLGPDCIIDFVNSPKTVEPALDMLKKRGLLILVGLFGGSAEINLPLMPIKNHSIIGSYTGRLDDLVELVDLVKHGKIDPIVAKTFSLKEANEALQKLNDGEIIGRAVLKPND